MNPDQQRAILGVALLAAFADGANDEREREQIRRLAETLGGESGDSKCWCTIADVADEHFRQVADRRK